MKRMMVSSVLLVSAFACTGAPETGSAPAPVAAHEVVSQDFQDAADDLATSVPTGTFATPAAFCDAQKKLIAPKLADANTVMKGDGMIDKAVEASCVEDHGALAKTTIMLGKPFTELTAVTFEAGFSSETYLLARTADGWSAVRAAVLYLNHDDPGCPSMEYPLEIAQVRTEHGALVVTTTAERGWYSDEDQGELSLTYVRACRPAAAGIACGTPEVASAKLVLRDDAHPEIPLRTRFFATTYQVGGGVMIEPAQRFDEAAL